MASSGRSMLVEKYYKTHFLVTLASLLVLVVVIASGREIERNEAGQPSMLSLKMQREKRAPNTEAESERNEPSEHNENDENESNPEPEGSGDEKKGVSLSMILGLMLLVCTIIYCIGISYKIFKICKGEYVEEEPVFLKYK